MKEREGRAGHGQERAGLSVVWSETALPRSQFFSQDQYIVFLSKQRFIVFACALSICLMLPEFSFS